MILPSDPHEKVQFLVKTYRRVRDRQLDYMDNAIKFLNMYESYVDPNAYPLKFKMFYPISFSIIETILPRFVHGLLYRNPLMQVMKAHPITSDDAVYAAGRLLNNKWMTDSHTWLNMYNALKEHFITGWGCGKVAFRRTKRHLKMKSHFGTTEDVSYYETNRPMFYQRDTMQVFPDLDRPYAHDQRFCFDVIIKGMDEIRHSGLNYHNLRDLQNEKDWPVSDLWVNQRLRAINPNRPSLNYVDLNIIPDKPRELLEVVWREWTRKGEEIHLITIGNEKVLLRDEIIDYWPWIHFINNGIPNEFLGRSELHSIERLQMSLNDTMNMTMENMLMALTKMWIVGDEADADLDQFVLEPMNVIQVTDISQIKAESWGDISPSSLQMQRTIIEAIQQSSGISDMLRGATPPRKEFATTVLALQQAAEARIDSKIKISEKTAIVPIAETMLKCAQAYLDQPDYVTSADDPNQFDEIDMYKLQGVYDLKIHASSMGMKELQRAALNDFVPSAAQLLGQNTDMGLRMSLLKAILNTYDIDNIEELNKDIDKSIVDFRKQQAEQRTVASIQAAAGAGGHSGVNTDARMAGAAGQTSTGPPTPSPSVN